MFYFLMDIFQALANFWLTSWSNSYQNTNEKVDSNYYLGIYAALGIVQCKLEKIDFQKIDI
jgi:hypothetical protein